MSTLVEDLPNNKKEDDFEAPCMSDVNLMVKAYLDSKFLRHKLSELGDNGNPKETPIVFMLVDNKPVKKMDDKQLYHHLQGRYPKLKDIDLLDIMKAWYYNLISPMGTIMKVAQK